MKIAKNIEKTKENINCLKKNETISASNKKKLCT
jgi:hypothetical protein